MEWFVQLHKKICDWEWYTDIPTCKLFFHILLKCNYKEAKWKWKVIKPWEFITSLEHLSLETGLTRQQVRTAINKLKSTWEITHYSTNEYTTLELNNWESYNTRDNIQITNEQQTNNKRITTTNKNNKEYKENKEYNTDTDISKDIWSNDLVNKSNPDINNLIQFIKETVEAQGFIYKAGEQERNRAKNILTWKDFWATCEKANMSRIDFCYNIILTSTKLDFWNWKIYNAESLYTHYAKVYNDAVNLKAKKQKDTSLIIF